MAYFITPQEKYDRLKRTTKELYHSTDEFTLEEIESILSQQRKEILESLLKRMPNERSEDDPEWVGYNCCLIEIEDLIKSKLEI